MVEGRSRRNSRPCPNRIKLDPAVECCPGSGDESHPTEDEWVARSHIGEDDILDAKRSEQKDSPSLLFPLGASLSSESPLAIPQSTPMISQFFGLAAALGFLDGLSTSTLSSLSASRLAGDGVGNSAQSSETNPSSSSGCGARGWA